VITWWVYYAGEPVASIRADEHASENQVRGIAYAQNERTPICYPESPGEHALKIRFGEVRRG
jgi:hypothetical protein